MKTKENKERVYFMHFSMVSYKKIPEKLNVVEQQKHY